MYDQSDRPCIFCGTIHENVFTCSVCWDYYTLEPVFQEARKKHKYEKTIEEVNNHILNLSRKVKLEKI